MFNQLLKNNICLKVDSYKVSQWPQYPANSTYLYSYFEHRKGGKFEDVMFFGLQELIKKHLIDGVSVAQVEAARPFLKKHFNGLDLFYYDAWMDIATRLKGMLPIRIKAVPEGTVVPESNILMSVENTDPKHYWLVNYLETILSQIWYPDTVATNSWWSKKTIKEFMDKSCDTLDGLDYKLHDFGYRGVSSNETAGIGGLAHLVSFKGTDNIQALIDAAEYYNCDMAGTSIPATEHSTITSWTQDGEVDAYRNVIEKFGHMPMVACVSDSYDIERACRDYWGRDLKDKVLSMNGILVVRPDSGIPYEIVSKMLTILMDKFGHTYNRKGYKVLNPHVRMIQGDGVDYEMTRKIYSRVVDELHMSADNLALGSGGGLLQKFDRDTQRSAFKCSYIEVNGFGRDVYKNPITDSGKVSKKGKMGLYIKDGTYKTGDYGKPNDVLREVFCNGELLIDENFDTIRERAKL